MRAFEPPPRLTRVASKPAARRKSKFLSVKYPDERIRDYIAVVNRMLAEGEDYRSN